MKDDFYNFDYLKIVSIASVYPHSTLVSNFIFICIFISVKVSSSYDLVANIFNIGYISSSGNAKSKPIHFSKYVSLEVEVKSSPSPLKDCLICTFYVFPQVDLLLVQ